MKEERSNSLIDKWLETVNEQSIQIDAVLELIKPIYKEKIKKNSTKLDTGFNIFEIISDTYYKENFHSEILSNLISPYYHEEGSILLNEFLNCLNLFNNKINHEDFENPVVENEKDKIDIRIRDITSKKSIIIENKINDAIDQHKQLPRYLEIEKKAGYEVVAIVYLTLVKGKRPSQKHWTKDEKTEIDNLLILLPTYTNIKKHINLCDNWITPTILKLKNVDVISILRQYSKIITYLSLKKMDKLIIGKFYNQIQKDENFQTALSIRNMLSQLCEYRAKKLYEKFASEGKPLFEQITPFPWKSEWRTKFEKSTFIDKVDLCFEIVYQEEKSTVRFCEQSITREDKDKIYPILESLNIKDEYIKIDNYIYFKDFKFPSEEEELYTQVETILAKLKNGSR